MNDTRAHDPLAVSVQAAAKMINLSEVQLYKEMNAGRLPSKKVGKRRLLLVADIQRFLEQLPAA